MALHGCGLWLVLGALLAGMLLAALDQLRAARCHDLVELLDGWSPERHPELAARLRVLAGEFIDQDVERLRTDERLRVPWPTRRPAAGGAGESVSVPAARRITQNE